MLIDSTEERNFNEKKKKADVEESNRSRLLRVRIEIDDVIQLTRNRNWEDHAREEKKHRRKRNISRFLILFNSDLILFIRTEMLVDSSTWNDKDHRQFNDIF